MSIQEEETTVAAEMNATEGYDGTSLGFSPDMIEERIKANFEPLLAQTSALTANDGQINPRQLGQRIHDGKYPRDSIVFHRRTRKL